MLRLCCKQKNSNNSYR